MSPAKVISVVADEDEKEAQVIVPDYQLSLAIGKEGQNARLAARLTTYKIDIKSETQARELGLFDDMDFGEEGFEGEYEKDVERQRTKLRQRKLPKHRLRQKNRREGNDHSEYSKEGSAETVHWLR